MEKRMGSYPAPARCVPTSKLDFVSLLLASMHKSTLKTDDTIESNDPSKEVKIKNCEFFVHAFTTAPTGQQSESQESYPGVSWSPPWASYPQFWMKCGNDFFVVQRAAACLSDEKKRTRDPKRTWCRSNQNPKCE